MTSLAIVAAAASVALGASRAARPASRTPSAGRRYQPQLRRPVRVACSAVAASVFATALLAVAGPFGLLCSATAVVSARVVRRRRRDQRRRIAIDEGLPHAIELLVITVRAGLPPMEAVRAVGAVVEPPVRAGFDEVMLRLERGQRLADALGALPEVLGPGALAVADGIAAADRYGTPLAPVLDRLALEARESRRRAAEARARTLPVRLSFPLVFCTLPSFVLMAIVPALLSTLSSLRAAAP